MSVRPLARPEVHWQPAPSDGILMVSGKMPIRRYHQTALTAKAVELLPMTAAGKYLFPSIRAATRPIPDNTVNAALRRLGYDKSEVTAHGFRATASTLLNEMGKWHPDADRDVAVLDPLNLRVLEGTPRATLRQVRVLQLEYELAGRMTIPFGSAQ